ncbi:hypothetical protein E7Z53_08175 [Kocuria salina]|uniref:peptidoglycan DD-metalloendopeptidase family protein n=1 Tax=Kocuria salina TaxID=1929416 RepID=UPI00159496B9|nr:peptidoglycan DD-metalloendopeptidase family protein [Kocuria salina]NVC23418.1 hypothetical protein [Kocuria salina]
MAMRPVPEMFPITQTYRQNATIYNRGSFHGAIDYGVPLGTPIVAPEDGIVVFDGWVWDLPGGPNDWHVRWYLIKPARGDTRTGGGIVTIFRNAAGSHWGISHASRSYFNVGDRVRKGQVIQDSGTTGSSTGPHSHVNLWPASPAWGNGGFGAIDPAPYLTEPYRPLTAVSWQGSPTAGIGSTTRDTVVDFVDASEHNTVASVKTVPTDAIILRTGWGIGGDDKLFAAHLATARARKLRIGTYHYSYLHLNDPRAEARYYASRIPADAEFACLDYEDGIDEAADVQPAKVAAFAEEFRKHSKARLDLYTWAWAAERIDPAPFGGRLWLPDFGANPVFKNYVGVVEVPKVKGWTVIANQYGDRFTPATGGKFDINKHLGGMWAARATTAAAPADFLEEFFSMDQSKINAALNAWAKTGTAQSLLGRAVLDREFEDESGDKRMSLAKFLRYDKKNQAKIDAIARAVAPSTITAAVAEGLGNRTDIDPAELADLLAQRLLVHALNPTTEKGA